MNGFGNHYFGIEGQDDGVGSVVDLGKRGVVGRIGVCELHGDVCAAHVVDVDVAVGACLISFNANASCRNVECVGFAGF